MLFLASNCDGLFEMFVIFYGLMVTAILAVSSLILTFWRSARLVSLVLALVGATTGLLPVWAMSHTRPSSTEAPTPWMGYVVTLGLLFFCLLMALYNKKKLGKIELHAHLVTIMLTVIPVLLLCWLAWEYHWGW